MIAPSGTLLGLGIVMISGMLTATFPRNRGFESGRFDFERVGAHWCRSKNVSSRGRGAGFLRDTGCLIR